MLGQGMDEVWEQLRLGMPEKVSETTFSSGLGRGSPSEHGVLVFTLIK